MLAACVSLTLADEPRWLADAQAREGRLGELHAVTSADNQISFKVPVPRSALADGKTYYAATFQLGRNAVAGCRIFKEDINVAATLRAEAAATFATVVEPAQGRIEKKAIERVDAGAVGATPFLSVSWVYGVNDGRGSKLGVLRQYAASHAGHGVYCSMNELGYARTFEQVVRAVLESLTFSGDHVAPYYREVSVASVQGMRLGYSALDLQHDRDGVLKIKETTVLLVTVGADVLRAEDMYHLEWVRPDGALISGNHLNSSDGEVEENLSLKAGNNGIWRVEGKFKGKDVSEDISGVTPSSWLTQTNLLRALLAREKPLGAEASFTQWLSVDPGHFTESTAKVLAAIDARTYSVRATAGGTSADLVVNQGSGLVTSGTMQVGPVAMKVERIFVQGAP
jgi:hypothetical protein